MKKLIVLLLALSMVGFAFAQDAAPAYTLEGEASVTWGYNLADSTHGFNNAASFTLTFPLVAEGASGGASGEGVYGSIAVTDLDMSVVNTLKDDGLKLDRAGATVAAKIVINALYVGIYTTPSFTFNNAAFIPPYSIDGYDDLSSSAKSVIRATQTIKGGITVGYTLPETFGTLEVRIGSIGDWGVTDAVAAGVPVTVVYTATGDETVEAGVTYTDFDYTVVLATALVEGTSYLKTSTAAAVAGSADTDYVFGFNTTITPMAMLTVNLGAMYRIATDYAGVTMKATVKPLDGLTAIVAFDLVQDGSNAAPAWMGDLAGSVAYAFNEAKDSIGLYGYMADQNAVGAGHDFARVDAAVKFADAEGFVPGLTVDLGVFANDLLNDPAYAPLNLAVAEKLGYKAMLDDTNYVKIYQALATNLHFDTYYVNVGVDFGLIPNTVFNVDYTFGSISDDVVGAGFVSGDIAEIADLGKGVLKATATVSF